MQFHETTALGTITKAPSLTSWKGQQCCQFTLTVAPPSKTTRRSEFIVRVLGGNAGKCWGCLRQGDEVAVSGVVWAELGANEAGDPCARLIMRSNFVRYSQEVLNRIEDIPAES